MNATDLSYAQFCSATYDAVPDIIGNGPNADIHANVYKLDGRTVICFRGSKEPRDWLLDIFAVPALDLARINDLRLGLIHTGFMIAAQSVLKQVQTKLVEPDALGRTYALCGHSLGGALALLVGAMMMATNKASPTEIVTFGAPRAGMLMLQMFLHKIPVRQYRFGADFVPLVPTHPYCHVREPLIQIGKPIVSTDVFANHHVENYVEALTPPSMMKVSEALRIDDEAAP